MFETLDIVNFSLSNEANDSTIFELQWHRRGCLITCKPALIHSWSSNEDASATGLLDSLLSGLGEELGSHDDGDLGEGALAEDLEIALRWMIYKIIIYSFGDIDNSGLVLAGLSLLSCLFWHERPDLVKVHDWGVVLVSLEAEGPHTTLTEVPWMAIRKGQTLITLQAWLPQRCREAKMGRHWLTICSCWFSCGACHQPYLYHRDAFCVCQLYRVRVKRVLSTS